MKHQTCGLIALAALALPFAASAETADWTGFYVGFEVGGAGAKADVSSTDFVHQVTNINPIGPQPLTVVPGTLVAVAGDDSKTSVLWGGAAGYLGQSGEWVFGVEGDLHGGRDVGEGSDTVTIPTTILSPPSTLALSRDAHTDYDWSARGKLGYAFDRTLVYATGGVVSARVRVRAIDTYTLPAGNGAPPASIAAPALGPIVTTAEESRTMTGWTVGVGVEQQVSEQVSIGLDGRYNNFGHKTFGLANQTVTSPPLLDYGEGSNAGLPMLAPPGANPGASRVSLSDWRVAARVLWRF